MDALTDSLRAETHRRRELLLADPFGEGITGAFFGNDPTPSAVTKSYRFERLGTDAHPFLIRVRSLPVRAALDHVLGRIGETARPLMEEWRGLFAALEGGADALAAELGYEPALDYAEDPPSFSPRALVNIAGGSAGYGEANEIYEAELARRDFAPARTPELHLLEDAKLMTALVREGVPVTFALFFRQHPRLLKFSKRGRPRIVKPKPEAVREITAGFGSNNAYWLMTSFTSLCGRRMVETAGVRHLVLTLLDMARQGMKRAFVKDTFLKGGTWVVDIDGVRDEPSTSARLIAALGPGWFHVLARVDPACDDADVRRFVVQEFVPFVREHRFFCVEGRIVASTASDRGLSVLDAPPARRRLDDRVAVLAMPASEAGPYDRGPTSSAEDRAGVARMARLVRRMLARAGKDDFVVRAMLPRAFVVDAGIAADGTVGLIEINTFRNAGLYAIDYDRVARALTGAARWSDWMSVFEGKAKADDPDGRALGNIGTVARLVIKAMPAEMTKGPAVVWTAVEDIAAELGRVADARQAGDK